MPFMPFNILGIWFRGLLSLAIIAGVSLIEHNGRFNELVAEFTESCLAAGVALAVGPVKPVGPQASGMDID
jgi:hypothetical protein